MTGDNRKEIKACQRLYTLNGRMVTKLRTFWKIEGRKIVWELLETAGAAAATYQAGKWLLAWAYLERGYEAVGGEYLILPVFYWFAYQTVHNFIGFWRREVEKLLRCGSADGQMAEVLEFVKKK